MKTLMMVILLAIPVLAKDKPFVATKPTISMVRPYVRSSGSPTSGYFRASSAPNTGTIKLGKHPRF